MLHVIKLMNIITINGTKYVCAVNNARSKLISTHREIRITEKEIEKGGGRGVRTKAKPATLVTWQFDPTTGPKRPTRTSFLRADFLFIPRATPPPPRDRLFLFLFSGLRNATLDLIHSPWRAFRYALPALISCLAPGLNLSKMFCKNKQTRRVRGMIERPL